MRVLLFHFISSFMTTFLMVKPGFHCVGWGDVCIQNEQTALKRWWWWCWLVGRNTHECRVSTNQPTWHERRRKKKRSEIVKRKNERLRRCRPICCYLLFRRRLFCYQFVTRCRWRLNHDQSISPFHKQLWVVIDLNSMLMVRETCEVVHTWVLLSHTTKRKIPTNAWHTIGDSKGGGGGGG